MLFLQAFMANLILTKSSGPKCYAFVFTPPIFEGFCVCHTDLSGGRHAKQGECLSTTKTWPFIWRLSASQSSEHFLPELKDVAVCI
jgi:hypothetical protein